MFNPNSYVYFVSKRQHGSPYGFTTYSDKNGNICMITDKKDKNGDYIPRKFSFGRKERAMRIPKEQKDINGNLVVEFLRNHPECEGSDNNIGQITLFREINDNKDAELAVSAKSLRLEAENKAFALDGADLVDMCALIGQFSDQEGILKHKILEYAGNEPDVFLSLYNSPDRKVKSIIRKGIQTGVLKQQGAMVSWESTVLGGDEEKAIETLLKDKKLFTALEDAIRRTK